MQEELERDVLKCCDDLFPSVIDFTKEMVREYSVLGEEKGTLDVVERELSKLSLPTTRVPMKREELASNPLYAPVEWDHEDKYNLVSRLNPDGEGKSLVFNGHLDVVSADPFDMWTQPPNEPWEKDGWLYGRGSGDMQAGVAAMIYAVHAIHHAGYKISSPLTIQAVVEEECSGNGALACLHHGYNGDFVLIPEPFGPQIYAGQVGVLWFKIVVKGVPVHVLDTSSGTSAIEKLQLLIPYLKELEDDLNASLSGTPYDQLEHPYNFNVGNISGGNWPSSVPAYADLEGRIGFPPGMAADEIMQKVTDRIEEATRKSNIFGSELPVVSFHGFRSEGHMVDLDDPGIELLSECHKSLTQQEIGSYLSTCTTDLRAFNFYDGTGGTCYGPVAKNIHGIDECVDLESVRQVLRTYALFICRWCAVEKQ